MTAIVLADAWRILFLTVSAPIVGAAVMALIGALTGGRWPAASEARALLPIVAIAAALLGLAQLATPPPPHLALWLHPLAVGLRDVAVAAALWLAVGPTARPLPPTRAAIALAAYAVLVTPIASDWMLGGVPGHAVSAVGMMLACQQIATACALPLALGKGDERQQRDLAKLMIAAALGLGYLLFVDYLIIWFGNLPSHVGFYVARSTGGAWVPLAAAMILGWAVPIALLSWRRSRALAGGSVLSASFLVDGWWVGGGWAAILIAALAIAMLGLPIGWKRGGRRPAHA